jgi:hypothetical protein
MQRKLPLYSRSSPRKRGPSKSQDRSQAHLEPKDSVSFGPAGAKTYWVPAFAGMSGIWDCSYFPAAVSASISSGTATL